MISQFKEILGKIIDVDSRLRVMESFNQARVLRFGNGTINRILIDGINAKLKISIAGVDIDQATNTQLIFSTDFGYVIESQYRLTDTHRYTNNTTFIYHGPQNPVTLEYQPIRIMVNIADLRNVSVYLETNMSGQGNAYCEAKLYNMHDAVDVANSLLQSNTGGDSYIFRSPALTLASTTGDKFYTVKFRRVNGTSSDYPSLFDARLIIRTSV